MESPWQGLKCGGGPTGVVLREVMHYLTADDLEVASVVCWAWYHASTDNDIWRRLLRREGASPETLQSLRNHRPGISWFNAYKRSHADWICVSDRNAYEMCFENVDLAALSHSGLRLVTAHSMGTVMIWEWVNSEWQQVGLWASDGNRPTRLQWAPDDDRFLVIKQLTLVQRYELAVFAYDDGAGLRLVSRAGCSGAAAACWADFGTILTLQLRMVAPRRAFTCVWLNSPTQETHSEYAGVSAPLFRIYNEAAKSVTHVLVMDALFDVGDENAEQQDTQRALAGVLPPGPRYHRAIRPQCEDAPSVRTMVCVMDNILSTWPLPSTDIPPLLADSDLRERLAIKRERESRAARSRSRSASPPPVEEEVRAVCTPPAYTLTLPSSVLGIVDHHRGRCVWVYVMGWGGAAWCVSVPALAALCRLPPALPPPPVPVPIYLQPTVNDIHVAVPSDGWASRVLVWSGETGQECRGPAPGKDTLIAAMLPPSTLPPSKPAIVTVTKTCITTWHSKAPRN